MTPAIKRLNKSRIQHQIHSYKHDDNNPAYGLEAADKLGLDPAQVFKTLIVTIDQKRLAVAIVPVTCLLDLKQMARALKGKKAAMAEAADAERATGYVVGGISPVGQKKRLPTVIDNSAKQFSRIFVSAGRRGLEIELSSDDLCQIAGAIYFDIAQK